MAFVGVKVPSFAEVHSWDAAEASVAMLTPYAQSAGLDINQGQPTRFTQCGGEASCQPGPCGQMCTPHCMQVAHVRTMLWPTHAYLHHGP